MIVKIHDCDSPDILPTSYRKYVDCGSVGMQNIGDTYILQLIDDSTNSTWLATLHLSKTGPGNKG